MLLQPLSSISLFSFLVPVRLFTFALQLLKKITMPVAVDEETSRQRLLGSLTGQDLHIPDLQPLLSSWPQYVSPQLERLKKDVDEKLERYCNRLIS